MAERGSQVYLVLRRLKSLRWKAITVLSWSGQSFLVLGYAISFAVRVYRGDFFLQLLIDPWAC